MPGREPDYSPENVLVLARARMPFGKYKGVLLIDLPVAYLAWFARKGFPRGKLGEQLESMFEIKHNGLVGLIEPLVTRR